MKNHCSTDLKKAHHSDKLKKDLLIRLSKIEGQIRGISKMIGGDTYCDDVIHQISSTSAALNSIKKLLLEAHIRSCVIDQIKQGEETIIDELMITIGKILK